MKRTLMLIATGVVVWLGTGVAQPAQVVVVRNVNLRPEPRSDVDSIELYAPPTLLSLIETDKQGGYFHVKDSADHEGWVWAKNVRPAEPPANEAHETAATQLSPTWEKPDLASTTWHGNEGDCAPEGDGQDDISTDRRKNRSDSPGGSHPVAFASLRRLNLPYPDAPNHRDGVGGWTAAQLAQIGAFEGEAITVEGYMFAVRLETSGSGEATNCHQHHQADTDVHIALTEHFGDLEPTAVVVETTPRIRKDHPNWAASQLETCCKGKNVLVRITGWTMVDPFHISDVGVRRQTLWEIHPVTRIEIFKNGRWVNSDDGG